MIRCPSGSRALGLGLLVVAVTIVFFGLVPALLLLGNQIAVNLKSGERGSSKGTWRLYAGASNFLPLEIGWRQPFVLDGQPRPARKDDAPQAQMHSVSEGYFEAMGASLVTGRSFTAFDSADAAGVIVVNESFARRCLEGRGVSAVIRLATTGIGPLGVNLTARQQHHEGGLPFEVVGIVKDIRNVPLGQATDPAFYSSTRQFPFSEVFIAVRARDTATALAAICDGLKAAAPEVPMATAKTWGDRFAARTAEPRLLMSLLLVFGAQAALLAAMTILAAAVLVACVPPALRAVRVDPVQYLSKAD